MDDDLQFDESRPPVSFKDETRNVPQSNNAKQSRSASFWAGVPNPFYIISAALFVHGTVLPAEEPFSPVLQVGLSLAYIGLCTATTVWLIKRLGRWDDARSLVVIVAGMFLAVSLEADDGLLLLSVPVRWAVACGFFLSAVTAFEVIRRGCRLGLPRSFTLAFYAQWAVILLAPAFMSSDVTTARLQIVGFALVAAAGWLLYLPALGRSKPNATVAWSYPLCPWLLVTLTGGATLVRLYFLTISFDPIDTVFYPKGSWNWSTILSADFAVPFVLALSILLGRSGRKANGVVRQDAAIALGLIALVCSLLPPASGVAADFRSQLAEWVDVPTVLVLATLGVMTLHWLRGVPAGRTAWILTMSCGAMLLPATDGAWSGDVGIGLLCTTIAIGLVVGFHARIALFWTVGTIGIWLALFRGVPATWAAAPWRVPEAAAVLLFAIAAFRFSLAARSAFAALASLSWGVMLFPVIRDATAERMPLLWLAIVGFWLVVATPFVIRFRDLPLVTGPFALVIAAVGYDMVNRLFVDPKTGRISWRVMTLAGAALMFVCGIVISHQKTRRETIAIKQ